MSQVPRGWLWREQQVAGGLAVVFDIDGVLANADDRQHYICGPRRDWTAFFQACDSDQVIAETERLLHLLDPNLTIILLTGRPEDVQDKTVEWLNRNHLRWDALIMRHRGDYAASLTFKQQTVRKLKTMGFDLRLAFEDDSKNRDMFEDEGVPCVYIHSGYYESRDAQERKAQ